MLNESSRLASRFKGPRLWVALFAIGAVVRLVLLAGTSDLGTPIVDEQHYVQLANRILAGDGFAWAPGVPTSIRPPLYPAALAGLWSVFGPDALQIVRLSQILLAALSAFLVYRLGERVYDKRVGKLAALAVWLYPSLIFFNLLILTETLFSLLLIAFLLLAVAVVQNPRPGTALLCGLTLGLGALTRSVLWPVPLVLCPLLLVLVRGRRQRLVVPALVFAGYALVVAPWAIRNTRLQGVVTIVDTMGGMNLRMGNYEHTPDDRMWDAVALDGTQSWSYALQQDTPGGTSRKVKRRSGPRRRPSSTW